MSTYRISSEKLKKLRKRARLTQEELAALAECSDRLIRKAEAGGALRYRTIEQLCGAFTQCGIPLAAEQLIAASLVKAQLFVAIIRRQNRSAGDHSQTIVISEELQLFVAGQSPAIPFAGHWKGRSGLESFLDSFFSLVRWKPATGDVRYAESDNHIVASWIDHWHFDGISLGKVWCNCHMQFNKQVITKVDFQYDTGAILDVRLRNATEKSCNSAGCNSETATPQASSFPRRYRTHRA